MDTERRCLTPYTIFSLKWLQALSHFRIYWDNILNKLVQLAEVLENACLSLDTIPIQVEEPLKFVSSQINVNALIVVFKKQNVLETARRHHDRIFCYVHRRHNWRPLDLAGWWEPVVWSRVSVSSPRSAMPHSERWLPHTFHNWNGEWNYFIWEFR